MSNDLWSVTFIVHREKANQPPRLESFKLEINPEEYVLDGVEKIWAYHDRTLLFRHACHHSTCGACGMLVNGAEKLTCITKIKDVTQDGGTIKVEPMHNFPVISDLVVDTSSLYAHLDAIQAKAIATLREHPATQVLARDGDSTEGEEYTRLIDCIECGLCVSACPIAATNPDYLGPAVLAAIQLRNLKVDPELIGFADSTDGVWRCHSAFECSEVCPSFVEPAWRIMDLRKQVVGQRFQQLFKRG